MKGTDDSNDLVSAACGHKQSMQAFYEMNFWYWDYIAYSLDGLARLAGLENKFERAAQFFGALDRLFRLLANTLSPIERGWRENDLAWTRKSLGGGQFQRLWQKGYALTPEQVIVYASGVEG